MIFLNKGTKVCASTAVPPTQCHDTCASCSLAQCMASISACRQCGMRLRGSMHILIAEYGSICARLLLIRTWYAHHFRETCLEGQRRIFVRASCTRVRSQEGSKNAHKCVEQRSKTMRKDVERTNDVKFHHGILCDPGRKFISYGPRTNRRTTAMGSRSIAVRYLGLQLGVAWPA